MPSHIYHVSQKDEAMQHQMISKQDGQHNHMFLQRRIGYTQASISLRHPNGSIKSRRWVFTWHECSV